MSSGLNKNVLLVILLLVSLVIYQDLCGLDAVNGWTPVLLFLRDMAGLFAVYWIAFCAVRNDAKTSATTVALILAGAILFRFALLPAGLHLSPSNPRLSAAIIADVTGERVAFDRFQLFDCDVWRYLWDGHVWAHGYNPYRFPPVHPDLSDLAAAEPTAATDQLPIWGDIRENIHYRELPTVYPPAAEILFRLSHFLAPGSVLVMKMLVVVLDLGAIGIIMLALRAAGMPVSGAILYAWNPLVVKVFAGSAHYDSLLTLLLAGVALAIILNWRLAAGALVGLSILSKLAPIVLIPFLYRRGGWRSLAICGTVVLLGIIPIYHSSADGLAGFAEFGRSWKFNAGPYTVIEASVRILGLSDFTMIARAISACFIILGLFALDRADRGLPRDFARLGAWALGAVIVFSPVVNPWYVTWTLPFAVLSQRYEWLGMSALVCLAFLVMVSGEEFEWVLYLEYGLFAAVVISGIGSKPDIRRWLRKGVSIA